MMNPTIDVDWRRQLKEEWHYRIIKDKTSLEIPVIWMVSSSLDLCSPEKMCFRTE